MSKATDPPGAHEVVLWAVRMDPFDRPELLDACRAVLSDHERQRADRFFTSALTERFIVSHALVRDVLAESTGVPAHDLKFTEDDLGRPRLEGVEEIDFNLSHTDGMAIVGVARHRLGVDVERFRDGLDLPGLGRRVLTPRERKTIEGPEAPEGRTRFFEYWTLKEAYAKALGIGIRMPFRDIDVQLGEQLVVDLSAVADDATRWRFELFGDAEFRVAIVAKPEKPADITIRVAEGVPRTCEKRPWTLAKLASSHR
jgi:4'-phosphopantetheinyl transferase